MIKFSIFLNIFVIANRMNYEQADYSYLSLRSWINVIIGKMTSIDRRKKEILINERTFLPYDHLVLCTGEQYYLISPMSNKVWNSYSKSEVKPHLGRPLFGNFSFAYSIFPMKFLEYNCFMNVKDMPPKNVFVINDEYDAETLLMQIQKNNLLSSHGNDWKFSQKNYFKFFVNFNFFF